MRVYVGLGANLSGIRGTPLETISWSQEVLKQYQIHVKEVSPCYGSRAIGRGGQNDYVNSVILIETSLPALSLLRVLKTIEWRAGRQRGKVWAARSLDLDIIDYSGSVINWKKPYKFNPYQRKRLILPHPEAHKRPFVMKPLLDIAPRWQHPVYKISIHKLWHKLQKQQQGKLLGRL